MGSPPQVRGKQIYFAEFVLTARITPAGAGKTFLSSCFLSLSKDHPRRCGENENQPFFTPPFYGSPPQVRGKHGVPVNSAATGRITPAGAGKTELAMEDGKKGDGSPPQVRGKRSILRFGRKSSRITPAGAGKTTITLA